MNISIYRRVNLQGLTEDQIEAVRLSNELLKPEEHAPDCPVRQGASADCVWPLSVCYAFAIADVYHVDVKETPDAG